MLFDDLMAERQWRPIRNCPGRFVLVGAGFRLAPEALLAGRAVVYEFDVETARDRVAVAPFGQGGLISYKRPDGTCLHTLNDAAGFLRKLDDLGIAVPECV
jgi:hypothetical protein